MAKEKKRTETEKTKVLKKLLKTLNFNENMVKDNKIGFGYKEKSYRVRMPNAGEELEANDRKNLLYIELLKDDNYLTEEQLKELYRKKNVKIDELDKQFEDISEKLKNTQIKLAKIGSENKEALKILTKEIMGIKDKLIEISQKKVDLLQYSIEAKVSHFYYMYLAYLITERLEKNKWLKNWKSYEEFEKDEAELVGLAVAWTTNLLYGVKQENLI